MRGLHDRELRAEHGDTDHVLEGILVLSSVLGRVSAPSL